VEIGVDFRPKRLRLLKAIADMARSGVPSSVVRPKKRGGGGGGTGADRLRGVVRGVQAAHAWQSGHAGGHADAEEDELGSTERHAELELLKAYGRRAGGPAAKGRSNPAHYF
jgi:hypothetical protein